MYLFIWTLLSNKALFGVTAIQCLKYVSIKSEVPFIFISMHYKEMGNKQQVRSITKNYIFFYCLLTWWESFFSLIEDLSCSPADLVFLILAVSFILFKREHILKIMI